MSSDTHPLCEKVLTALRNLGYPAGLRAIPLIDNPDVRRSLTLLELEPSPDKLAVALRDRLESIIEGLRPEGDENLKQREWLRYYLLHYRFRRGQSTSSVQQVLGIGRTLFYELRNEAVDSVATLLLAGALPSFVSLVEPIPRTPDFVGRKAELALYKQSLLSQNFAVIHGFAGTGKTALSAELAAERQNEGHPLIWITFYPDVNTDLDSFLNTLACALEELGDDKLWAFLSSSAQSPQPYPVDARIHYALNCLAKAQIILCLDDIHLVEKVAGLQRFLSSLVSRQGPARIPLIAATRNQPAFVQGRHCPPLAGLDEGDTKQLLRATGVDWLDDANLTELQKRTEGNAAFLKFFVAWAQALELKELPAPQRSIQTQDFIAQLGRSPPSQSFLLDKVLVTLDSNEYSVLERMALCRKAVDLRDGAFAPLFARLDSSEVSVALVQLERRNLLMRQGEAAIYRLHDLLRHYLLIHLDRSPTRRASLHRALAGYHKAVNDVLEAAFHHCQAGETQMAVALLTERARQLIQEGYAAVIVALAEEIPLTDLMPAQRLDWYETLVGAWQIAGNYDERAVAYLSHALEQASTNAAERYVLLLARERVFDVQGLRQAQCKDLEALQEMAETLGDDWRRAEAALRRASYAKMTGDRSRAIAAAQKALRLAQRVQDVKSKAVAYLVWGQSIGRQAKDYETIQYNLEQALRLA